MTARELVAELLKVIDIAGPDLEVVTEGCDCNGDVASVSIYENNVYLERSGGGS